MGVPEAGFRRRGEACGHTPDASPQVHVSLHNTYTTACDYQTRPSAGVLDNLEQRKRRTSGQLTARFWQRAGILPPFFQKCFVRMCIQRAGFASHHKGPICHGIVAPMAARRQALCTRQALCASQLEVRLAVDAAMGVVGLRQNGFGAGAGGTPDRLYKSTPENLQMSTTTLPCLIQTGAGWWLTSGGSWGKKPS